MTSKCTKKAIVPLQGLDRHALTVGAISDPHSQIAALFGAVLSVVDLHGLQKAFWKSRPVDISQWR